MMAKVFSYVRVYVHFLYLLPLYLVLLVALEVKQCQGKPEKLKPRIINGYAVDIEYFPFMASLQVDGNHICGAAIISNKIIATAAHCDVYPPEFYKLRVGSTYYDEGGLLINVSEVIKHPKYNRKTADYDVAVLVLTEKLHFDDSVAPIALPDKNYSPPTGLGVVVLGWGTTDRDNHSKTSKRLQSASQRIINEEDCAPLFPPDAITERMFCAQNFYLKQDACTGDSGGPMYGRGVFLGVISWGIACADGTTPGVYTNVANVLDFIKTHLE